MIKKKKNTCHEPEDTSARTQRHCIWSVSRVWITGSLCVARRRGSVLFGVACGQAWRVKRYTNEARTEASIDILCVFMPK